MSSKVTIFDTTLRDGQQCPGAGMDFEHNLEYARLAAKCGIDVIEAGFPAAGSIDYKVVESVANEFATMPESPVVASLAQMREAQIETTIRALENIAKVHRGRLHFYLPVAPDLMDVSLGEKGADRDALLKDAARFTKMAIDAGLEVEFSPEGYSRMKHNFDFVTDIIRSVVEAGATTINCPDTIGGAFRAEEDYFVKLMQRHADIIKKEFPDKQIIWSCHCHNDYGLALENSLNAVFDGPALQIEGCINGIGERAGNTAIEQCVMVIKHFGERYPEKYYTDINTEYLKELSDFVAKWMLPRQPHWPISGANSARHSSGGHTNAVLKNPLAYQPYDPKEVGQEISLIFGPLSGGNHAKSIIEGNGYVCTDEEKAAIASYIKEVYKERRKGITDEELMEAYYSYRTPIHIESFDYGRTSNKSTITLEGKMFDLEGTISDALESRSSALAVLKHLIDSKFKGSIIDSYSSESVGTSVNALSLSTIILLMDNGKKYKGQGTDQDIEISAMKALIDAVNRAYVEMNFRK